MGVGGAKIALRPKWGREPPGSLHRQCQVYLQGRASTGEGFEKESGVFSCLPQALCVGGGRLGPLQCL